MIAACNRAVIQQKTNGSVQLYGAWALCLYRLGQSSNLRRPLSERIAESSPRIRITQVQHPRRPYSCSTRKRQVAFGSKEKPHLQEAPATPGQVRGRNIAAMSDDEADPELLALLRQHFQKKLNVDDEPETGVLEGAEYVYDNSIDVCIDMRATKRAAATIYAQMEQKQYSTATWAEHELHPKTKDDSTAAFIFTMDLLNFCFWSEKPEDERFAVEYRGKTWTGYWSMVASLQRALEEGIPITSSDFWQSEDECNMELMRHVFRSKTEEEVPLLEERLTCLREAGTVLYERYNCSVTKLIEAANGSAARLVNLLARDFDCFRDEHVFEGRRKPVRFLKRAQILVADIWACFGGEGIGAFRDIDKITMFADYRVPQILNTMGCLYYSPSLATAINSKRVLESGARWELQMRACSIWCVELIKREIQKDHPGTSVNAILIDFFLYDTMKELEAAGTETVNHHRTRSIWY